MVNEPNTGGTEPAVGAPAASTGPEATDLAERLKAIVAELETGIVAEPGDRMTPSEKLRAIADLIDRRTSVQA